MTRRREFTRDQRAQIVARATDAPFTSCAVVGCIRNANRAERGSRGWCVMHYTRWRRHGNPNETITTPMGEAKRFFDEVVMTYAGDDCLIWPYSTQNGYGNLHNTEGSDRVSRLACEAVNGAPPSPEHHAAHSCGNGNRACVNPLHVYWATPQQNQADRLTHGTALFGEAHPGAKLTEQDVRTIRALAGTITQRQIGQQFGISASMVKKIVGRTNWRDVV